MQQLINKGYFKDNFFDKEIYKNSKIKISKNTFIEVRMGTNNDNLKVVVNKNDNTEDKCIGSAINGNLFHLRLENDSKSYTDTIKLNVSKKDTKKVVKKYTVSINDEKNSVEDSSDGRNVTFGNLTNSTLYKIKACMTTEDNNYYCDYFGIFTKDFIKPKFDIKSGWEKAKTININYDDTPIYDNEGSHYFTSEVSGKVKIGNVYSCDDAYSNCNSTSGEIVESGKKYKLNGNVISFTTTDNIDKGVFKKLTAIIKDPANNSGENLGKVNKIDNIAPICNASSSNSNWTNQAVTISSTCYDGNGSGCEKTIFTKKINNDFVGNASIKVTDNAGNISTCKAPVMIDKTKPTCTNSGGGDWTNTDVTIKGICNDNGGSGCVKKNNDSYDNDGTVSKTIRNEGEHTNLSPGTVYDKAGNSTLCKSDRIVKIDKTKPTCTNSGGSDWTNKDVTIKGICNDNGGSGCVKKNNDSYDNDGTVSKTIINEGEYTNLSPGTVYDKAGNSTLCKSDRTVKIDKTPPEIRIKSDKIKVKQYQSKTVPYNSSKGKEFTFWYNDSGGSGVDNIVAQVYTMNGNKVCCRSKDGDWKSGELCSAHANDKANKWWRAYRITDKAGNYSKIICYYHTNTSDVTKKKGDFTKCTVSGHKFK